MLSRIVLQHLVLPELRLSFKNHAPTLLNVVKDKVDVVHLLLCHADQMASSELLLFFDNLNILLGVQAHDLIVKLLHLNYLGQETPVYVLFFDVFLHLLGIVKHPVFTIVFEDGLDDIFMKVCAQVLVFSIVPDTRIECKYVVD